jgi:hypothetical protein
MAFSIIQAEYKCSHNTDKFSRFPNFLSQSILYHHRDRMCASFMLSVYYSSERPSIAAKKRPSPTGTHWTRVKHFSLLSGSLTTRRHFITNFCHSHFFHINRKRATW